LFSMLLSPLITLLASPSSTIYTLSLHDALPISSRSSSSSNSMYIILLILRDIIVKYCFHIIYINSSCCNIGCNENLCFTVAKSRSEEHTSELQSRFDLVCRLLLEKKKYI